MCVLYRITDRNRDRSDRSSTPSSQLSTFCGGMNMEINLLEQQQQQRWPNHCIEEEEEEEEQGMIKQMSHAEMVMAAN